MDTSINIETFYRILRDVSTSVHSSTDVKEVLGLVVKLVTEAINAKGSLLRSLDLETNQWELSTAYGISERYLSKGHVSNNKFITELCMHNKVIIIEDVQADLRVQYPREAQEEGIRMMLDTHCFFLGDNSSFLSLCRPGQDHASTHHVHSPHLYLIHQL